MAAPGICVWIQAAPPFGANAAPLAEQQGASQRKITMLPRSEVPPGRPTACAAPSSAQPSRSTGTWQRPWASHPATLFAPVSDLDLTDEGNTRTGIRAFQGGHHTGASHHAL
jgi:hypothetical protein